MKTCTKCKQKLPATREYFRADKRHKDRLHSWCKRCCNEYNKQYQKENREKHNEYQKQWQKENREKCNKYEKQYRKSIKGKLKVVWNHINQRCYNPKHIAYHRYGGRGIENKFKNPNEFRNYVINELKYDTYDKIKGLQIDRIDNNGHYKPDNIRFVSAKENCNNRG